MQMSYDLSVQTLIRSDNKKKYPYNDYSHHTYNVQHVVNTSNTCNRPSEICHQLYFQFYIYANYEQLELLLQSRDLILKNYQFCALSGKNEGASAHLLAPKRVTSEKITHLSSLDQTSEFSSRKLESLLYSYAQAALWGGRWGDLPHQFL
eukprot:TRINITY_DN4051_c1_g1_i3.p3 TRINITY_DN4051_c1_g1~~TRINITY_DN4051_c1_g1_i3.p3  ORF type:complete len:150 (+),score=4.95 TRINITY_DN4051_c1_g1_i3:303-752(+)